LESIFFYRGVKPETPNIIGGKHILTLFKTIILKPYDTFNNTSVYQNFKKVFGCALC